MFASIGGLCDVEHHPLADLRSPFECGTRARVVRKPYSAVGLHEGLVRALREED